MRAFWGLKLKSSGFQIREHFADRTPRFFLEETVPLESLCLWVFLPGEVSLWL